MNETQFKALIWGAIGFLTPQILLWLAFGAYLLITGRR